MCYGGAMPRPHEDLTGQTFGRWTALELVSAEPGARTRWLCECGGCGRRLPVLLQNLRSGASTCCRWCRPKKRVNTQ